MNECLILLDRINDLEKQHLLILSEISNIKCLLSKKISPELERAVRQVARRAKSIDRQVPDQ